MADSNQDKTGIKTTQDIIDLRQRLGMSREEFGALAGVKADAVGKWERGVTFPTKAKVKALEAWLNTSYNRDAQQAFAAECEERDAVSPDGQATLQLERMAENAPDITPDLKDLLTDEERAAIEEICTPYRTPTGALILCLDGLSNLGISAHHITQALQALGNHTAKDYCRNGYPCAFWPSHQLALAHAIRSLIRVNLTDNPRRPTALIALAKRIDEGRVMTCRPYTILPQESPEDMTNIIPQAAANPQNVTIDWNALVGEHQGIKGVSLRHLLTLGLYSSYQKAKEALERVAEDFLTESLKSITLTTGGRPAEDLIITDLKVVKIFCMCAGTPVGQQIRDTIIAHHDELQAMLAGDAAAQARHEQAKAPQAAVSADPLDALASMIEQMRAQRDALAAHQQRQQALEENINAVGQRTAQLVQRLNSTPLAGERSAYQVAEEAGVKSGSGRPHSNSIVALMHEMGLPQEGHAWQVTTEINGKLADSWRFNATGAAMLKRELARLAQRGTVLEDGRIRFEVRGKTCTYTVYR